MTLFRRRSSGAVLTFECRSVGDQMAGDQGLHKELRKKTMDYVEVSSPGHWHTRLPHLVASLACSMESLFQ